MVGSSKTGLESSFGGGIEFEITAGGLTQNILQGDYEVRVCQQPCETVAEKSDSDKYTCTTPPIATIKSNELFKIKEESNLCACKYQMIYDGMDKDEAKLAFNDRSLPSIQGSKANCYVGVKFHKGYKGVLQEMSFFLDYFDVNKINNSLKFQGSNDGFVAETVDLLTMTEDVHEGWNYFDMKDLTDGIPKYGAYRLHNG